MMLGASFIAVGLPIFFLLQMYHDPRFIAKVNDWFAYFTLLTEKIYLPNKVKHTLLFLLSDIKGKRILEFGCSVGTFTLLLAERVKPNGTIFATDLSKEELKIARSRLRKRGYEHVHLFHDSANMLHPTVPRVDAVVSIGRLGYIDDTKSVLTQLNRRLSLGNNIVFLDYDRFFKIIPAIEWLSDNTLIRRVFRSCGFHVNIIRRNSLFWQYVYIYGTKIEDV
jgi:ubiquinone/menaquinone biosynthesis C-methylase UbiE